MAHKRQALLVGAILCLLLAKLSSADTLSRDVDALLQFKSGFKSNTLFNSWTGNDPCSKGWRGISCVNAAVYRLSFAKSSLNGTLNAGLGSLLALQDLLLNDNEIYGTIPKELANLVNIQTLDLSNNNLESPVPVTVLQMDGLNLSGNPLCSSTNTASCVTTTSTTSVSSKSTPSSAINATQLPSQTSTNCTQCDPLSGQAPGLAACTCVVPNVFFLRFNSLSLAEYNTSVEADLVAALASQLKLSAEQIRIMDRAAGSVIVTLQVLPINGTHLDQVTSDRITLQLVTNTVGLPQQFADYTYLTPSRPGLPFPVSSSVTNKPGILVGVIFGLLFPLLVVTTLVIYLYTWRKKQHVPSRNRDAENPTPRKTRIWDEDWENEGSNCGTQDDKLGVAPARLGMDAVLGEINRNTMGSARAGQVNSGSMRKPLGSARGSAGPVSAGQPPQSWGEEWTPSAVGLLRFTFSDLETATKGFQKASLVSQGSFGHVFQAHLPSRQPALVSCVQDGPKLSVEEFRSCAVVLATLQHQHLLPLTGYCAEGDERVLVYENAANGCLKDHLHTSEHNAQQFEPLGWSRRMKIALGIARALEYLHEVLTPELVYKDLRPCNVMLDENFNTKIIDHGVAAMFAATLPSSTSLRSGNFAYQSPEYRASGESTSKGDIFSFGVVLLEMLTGRKPVDKTRPKGQQSLLNWAMPQLEAGGKHFMECVDPILAQSTPKDYLQELASLAARCIQHDPEDRPLASECVGLLQKLGPEEDAELQASVGSNTLEVMARRQSLTRRTPLRGSTPMERVPEASYEVMTSPSRDDAIPVSPTNISPTAYQRRATGSSDKENVRGRHVRSPSEGGRTTPPNHTRRPSQSHSRAHYVADPNRSVQAPQPLEREGRDTYWRSYSIRDI